VNTSTATAPSPSPVYTGTWLVRSDRDPDTAYTIATDPRTLLYTCTCPDHSYRQRDCKHIRVVQVERGIRRSVRRANVTDHARDTASALEV